MARVVKAEVTDGGEPQPVREAAQALPRVPGYRLEGLLGRGSTGVVYRARQVSVDRVVALKILHKELVGARKAELRLQREARATAKLAHPNIVTAIDMGEVDGVWWYAMELVDGQPLHKILAESRLTEREALRLFIPIVEALQHLSERGIVHRDIKPSNILVDTGGRARLVDLGLAHAEDDPQITNHGGTLGTPHYISPEQARDPGSADAQSDLWSLGATLYHAVCGQPPFQGASVAEILSAVLHDKVRDPIELEPTLSSGLVLVLRKCLTRDRERRYQGPAALLADLERVRERRAPRVTRAGLDPVKRDPRRLLATAAWTTGLAGAVALLAIGVTRGGLIGPATLEPPPEPWQLLVAQAESSQGADLAQLMELLARSEPLVRAATLEGDDLRRVERAHRLLSDRLDSELWKIVREFDLELESTLQSRRYDEAQALLVGVWPQRLRERLGGQRLLPSEEEQALTERAARWAARITEARTAAVDAWRAALRTHWMQVLSPRIEQERARGAWRTARAVLVQYEGGWAAEVPAARTGLSEREVSEVQATLVADELTPRLVALDADWARTDQLLAAEVANMGAQLEQELQVGDALDAPARLQAWWEARVAAVPILPQEELTVQTASRALRTWATRLDVLERSLPAQSAVREWTRVQRACVELTTAGRRNYLAAVHLLRDSMRPEWPASIREHLDLLVREYLLLHEVLVRAAANLWAHGDREVEVTTGTLKLRGLVKVDAQWIVPDLAGQGEYAAAAVESLALPFGLVVSPGAAPYQLALRARSGERLPGDPPLVDAESLAALARLDRAQARDALLSVALHLQEGDLAGLRLDLSSPALERDDPLVWKAQLRLEEGLDGSRAAALERLRSLRREVRGLEARTSVDPQRFVWRVDDLLSECDALLKEDEKRELRDMRALVMAPAPQQKPADVSAFGADNVRLAADGRAVLEWQLNERVGGRLDAGGWRTARDGWSVVRALRDDEVATFGSPTLPLVAPLDPRAALSVQATCVLDAAEPPDLLLLSVCGVHALVVIDKGIKSARVLLDAAEDKDLLALVRRARAGEGRLTQLSGDTLQLGLVFTRKGDVVRLEMDGRALVDRQLRASAANGDQRVQLRSTRPVRWRTLTVDAATWTGANSAPAPR